MSTAAPQERPLKSDLHSIKSIKGHDACLPLPSQLEKLLGIHWNAGVPIHEGEQRMSCLSSEGGEASAVPPAPA